MNTVSPALVAQASSPSASAMVGARWAGSKRWGSTLSPRLTHPSRRGGDSSAPSSHRSQSLSPNGVIGTQESPATWSPSTVAVRWWSACHSTPSCCSRQS